MLKKVWDYIVNDMPAELIVSLFVMLFIAIIAIILGHKIKKADPTKPPKGAAFLADFLVDKSLTSIRSILGEAYEKFAPYYIFLILYIPLAFISGLFGLPSPIMYFSIPLTLAIVSFLGIQLSSIYYNRLGYLKSFTDPLPPWIPIMVPINLLGKISPLLSLSIRMFGNAVAGYMLMTLVYWATGSLSGAITQLIGLNYQGINFMGVVVSPFLHAYLDIFSAFIQTLIFVTLTMLLISVEIPAPVAKKQKKEKTKEIKRRVIKCSNS
mgnify:FL=1